MSDLFLLPLWSQGAPIFLQITQVYPSVRQSKYSTVCNYLWFFTWLAFSLYISQLKYTFSLKHYLHYVPPVSKCDLFIKFEFKTFSSLCSIILINLYSYCTVFGGSVIVTVLLQMSRCSEPTLGNDVVSSERWSHTLSKDLFHVNL